MAIAEISIIPLGTKTASVSKHIAPAVKVLQQEKEIKYQVTSMGTIIEGELDKVLAVAKKMHERTFNREITRVITIIEIDDRRDKASSINGKLNSLMKELKH